ncbi:hypothetical protein [Aliarcobacter butzleri]|uniref:Uncharacterized protein n=2 Tax=Aliarcobacter butzleri TaxID=28197 RepID=A0AAW7PYG7_9BACT|nr:hypothetical protein [Aliarcobacter butzleri]KLD97649.1 hypothetical protein AA20_10495 [Aliarcobacter butzleri L348]MCG3668540.1 hypothetical protein [Aliarcobacter butzleri]MDN5070633.1 hypothetical protein [Aliarcobacter butzleri]
MDKLPQRDDLIYKEIEKFQDYELTNCVAYEMMIRTDKDYHVVSNKSYVYKIDKIKLSDINLFGFQNLSQVVEKLYPKYIEDTKERAFDIFFKNSLFKQKEITDYLNEKDFENENLKEIYRQDFNQGKKFYTNNILNDLEYFIEYYLNNDDEFFNNIYIPTLLEPFLLDKNNCKAIIKEQKILKKMKLPSSRPESNFNIQKSCLLEINLFLPKEELISYISKIKDDFDKDNSIIKTPLELLGETLEKSDNKKIPKKPKASVYADWFYIYDYWKYEKTQGKTDKDIFVALEVENNVPYKEDMLRKIRDKMKYFIDDLGYKELITGVKNS